MSLARILKWAGASGFLALAGLALSGCGRRGDLVSPVASTAAPQSAGTPTPGSSSSAAGRQSKTTTKPVAPKQSFVLDPLL